MLYVTGSLADPAAGYAQATLQYLMALKTSGYENFQLSPVGEIVNWRLAPPWTEPLSYVRRTTEDHTNLALIHWLPEFLTNKVFMRGSKANYGLAVTEADRLPKWLVQQYNTLLSGLIVPTTWQRDVVVASGVELPVEVLPHPQGDYFWRGVEQFRQQRDEHAPYTFYYVGTWAARKNPEAVLRAYLRAFPSPTHDTRLVIKISRHKGVRDFLSAFVSDLTGSTARLEQDVQVIDDFLTDAQLMWLHAAGDCFVSAHCSEGWGIGLSQAALAGNRVISTNWSAPTTFLQAEAAGGVDIMVPYTMKDVIVDSTSTSFMFATTGEAKPQWASIDEDALVEALRRAAQERRVRSVQDTVALQNALSWQTVGAQFRSMLERIEGGLS